MAQVQHRLPQVSDRGKIFWCHEPHEDDPDAEIPEDIQLELDRGTSVVVTDNYGTWVYVKSLTFDHVMEVDEAAPHGCGWVPFAKLPEGWSPDGLRVTQADVGKMVEVAHRFVRGWNVPNSQLLPPVNQQASSKKGSYGQITAIRAGGTWAHVRFEHSSSTSGVIPASHLKIARWPFTAKHDFDPARETVPAGITNYITMERGEKGFVVSRTSALGPWWYVAIPGPNPRTGWAHTSRLTITRGANWNEFQITLAKLESLHRIGLQNPGARSTLFNTVTALVESFREFSWLRGSFANTIQSENGAQNLASLLERGLHHARTDAIISPGLFSANNLLNSPNTFKLGTNADISISGVYAIVYYDFPDGRDPEIYIGHSVQMVIRGIEHAYLLGSEPDSTAHYRSAHEARKRVMIPLCTGIGETKSDLVMLEQILICLFRNYHRRMLPKANGELDMSKARLDFLTSLSIDTAIEQAEDEEEEDSGSTSQPKTKKFQQAYQAPDLRSRRRIQLSQAHEIQRNMDSVFEKTGWKLRNKDWNGLNVSSPLGEVQWSSKTVWVKYDLGDRWQFRRSPMIARKIKSGSKHPIIAIQLLGPMCWGVSTTHPPDAIKEGSKYFIVFEIMKNGVRHPKNYSLAPDLGIWSDWDDQFTVGIKMEYEDENTGKWYQNWFQDSESPLRIQLEHNQGIREEDDTDDVPGSEMPYAEMMAVRRYFLRQKVAAEPIWYENYGIGNIREVVFDPTAEDFSHQIRILTPPIEHIPFPDQLSRDEIANKLIAAGARNVGRKLDDFTPNQHNQFKPEDLKRQGGPWKPKCDGCRLTQYAPHTQHKLVGCQGNNPDVRVANPGATRSESTSCVLQEGKDACDNCLKRGLVCSFTNEDRLRGNLDLQKLLMPKAFLTGLKSLTEDLRKKYNLANKVSYDPREEEIPNPSIHTGLIEALFLPVDDGTVLDLEEILQKEEGEDEDDGDDMEDE